MSVRRGVCRQVSPCRFDSSVCGQSGRAVAKTQQGGSPPLMAGDSCTSGARPSLVGDREIDGTAGRSTLDELPDSGLFQGVHQVVFALNFLHPTRHIESGWEVFLRLDCCRKGSQTIDPGGVCAGDGAGDSPNHRPNLGHSTDQAVLAEALSRQTTSELPQVLLIGAGLHGARSRSGEDAP